MALCLTATRNTRGELLLHQRGLLPGPQQLAGPAPDVVLNSFTPAQQAKSVQVK